MLAKQALINLLCYAIKEPNEGWQIADILDAKGYDRQRVIDLHNEMGDELEPTIATMPLEDIYAAERKCATKIVESIIQFD